MFHSTLLNTGLLISLFGGIVYWLKGLPKTIFQKVKERLIFNVSIYDTDELFYVLENWLFIHHNRKYKNVEAGYSIMDDLHLNNPPLDGKKKLLKKVVYRQNENSFVITYKGKRLLLVKGKQKLEHITDKRNLFSTHYNISGIKAKGHIHGLLTEITEEFNKSIEDNRVTIYICMNGYWEFSSKRIVKPLSNVVMNTAVKAALIQDINEFNDNQAWYRSNNLLFKRTYLMEGPPGTGKTTTAMAIASQLKRNICILNLNSITSDEYLLKAFSNLYEDAILLIEDVDSAFVQRANTKESKISFSCLLNCLDGAISKDGAIVIMTTNYIDKLDSALIRPGRVDRTITIPNAGYKEMEQYFKLFYGVDYNLSALDIDIPIAKVQEICLQHKTDHKKALRELTGPIEIHLSIKQAI